MKRPLLHVGYHKTGTTWLQNRFFVSEYGYGKILDHDAVSALIVDAHGSARDAEPLARAAEAGGATLESGHVPVVSSEILCGNPFHGGAGGAENARLLAAAFPDARILITIREQMRMLTSVYMQYLSRGGTRSPEDFFTEENAPGYPRFRTGHFRYDWLVGLYRDLFGAENVLVLTQEEMASRSRGVSREALGLRRGPAPGRLSGPDGALGRELPRDGGAAAAPDQPLPGRPGLAGAGARSGRGLGRALPLGGGRRAPSGAGPRLRPQAPRDRPRGRALRGAVRRQ